MGCLGAAWTSGGHCPFPQWNNFQYCQKKRWGVTGNGWFCPIKIGLGVRWETNHVLLFIIPSPLPSRLPLSCANAPPHHLPCHCPHLPLQEQNRAGEGGDR